MNRKQALDYRRQIVDEAKRQLQLVEEVSYYDKAIIKFKIRSYNYKEGVTNGRVDAAWGDNQVVGKVELLNSTSFRTRIYAAEKLAWPFSSDLQYMKSSTMKDPRFGLHPLKFQTIQGWEIVPETDLPLYVGWPVVYPIFIETFKENI